MPENIKALIHGQYSEKRKTAQRRAAEYKASIYHKIAELSRIDSEISDVASDYTRRMIEGENVKSEMEASITKLYKEKKDILEKHGISVLDFEPKYECDLCKDTGYNENGMCECFKKRIIEENFRNSNIGSTLSNQSFDKFRLDYYSEDIVSGYPVSPRVNMKRILNMCMKFADRFDSQEKSLLMLGGTGLGKTFLSTCIANELLNAGKSVIYISAVDFFKRIEKSRFDSEDTDVRLFEDCDLLIVDDLGTEAPSVYTTAVFSDILDKRIRCGRKMILSSNNSFKDFEKLYGERVFSRLAGNFDCMLFYGKDIRIQKFLGKAD